LADSSPAALGRKSRRGGYPNDERNRSELLMPDSYNLQRFVEAQNPVID
jgi:hypothetical protein